MSFRERYITSRKISIVTEVSKAGVSGITFLLMALLLGPDEYGIYVQFAAIALILVPITSVGYAFWVQPLTKRAGASGAASAAMTILFLLGIPGTVLSAFLTDIAFPHGLPTIFAVFAVEMLIFPLWSSLALAFLSSDSLIKYFLMSVSVPVVKLAGTLLALTTLGGGLITWGTVLVPLGLIGLVTTARIAGARGPFYGFAYARSWLRRGAGFAAVGAASAATDNVDKLMVGMVGGVLAAGNYGVAARFATYGVIPVRALALVAYPRYFQLAEDHNLRALRSLMYRTIWRGFWLGLASAAFVAGALTAAGSSILLQYKDSIFVGCILALVIPIRAIQYAAGDVSYAIGKSHWRLLMTVIGSIITAAGVAVGILLGESVGAAIGMLIASLVVTGMQLGYVERWISKNMLKKKKGRRRALLHNHG